MREMTIGNCENFALKLEEKQFCDNVCGQLSLKGKLYALLCDYITAPLNRFHANDMELERLQHEQLLKERAQSLLRIGHSQEVLLPAKDLLGYVLSYVGLDNAKYRLRITLPMVILPVHSTLRPCRKSPGRWLQFR